MSSTTFEHAYRPAETPCEGRAGPGERILNWLGRIGERTGYARQAAAFQRLNALSDADLARLGMTRTDLALRCFGGRALL